MSLKAKYHRTLTAKVTERQRAAIDQLATSKGLSIGEAVRAVLDEGLRGLEC